MEVFLRPLNGGLSTSFPSAKAAASIEAASPHSWSTVKLRLEPGQNLTFLSSRSFPNRREWSLSIPLSAMTRSPVTSSETFNGRHLNSHLRGSNHFPLDKARISLPGERIRSLTGLYVHITTR